MGEADIHEPQFYVDLKEDPPSTNQPGNTVSIV